MPEDKPMNSNEQCSPRSAKNCEQLKFSVLLNGQSLDKELENFIKLYQAYERHHNKRCKKSYYKLGIMALLEHDTTFLEVKRLLKHGVRTFLLDIIMHKREEIELLIQLLYGAIVDLQKEYFLHNHLVIGLAFQITGDCCRFGRFRNDCVIFMHSNEVITLTTSLQYRYSSVKKICYVINLIHYLPNLKLCDEVILGSNRVRAKVIKLFKNSCSISILSEGFLNSYDYIELPGRCNHSGADNTQLFKDDLTISKYFGAHYIMVPRIRCKNFVSSLKRYMQADDAGNWKLLGTIDFDYVQKHTRDLLSILKLLDGLLLTHLFLSSEDMQNYIIRDVIPIARCLKQPIIGNFGLIRVTETIE